MKKDALVFFSYRSHKFGYIEMLFDRLQQRAEQTDLRLHRGSLKDLHIAIRDDRMSIIESLTGRDLSTFALIYFELWYKSPQQALAAALFAERHKVPFFSKELLSTIPLTKVGELAKLADNGVPLPNSFISSARELKKVFKKSPPIDFPLIMKAADGYGGKNNFLVRDYDQLVRLLEENKQLDFVIQEFIENDCDYRCLVFGGKVQLVLQRTRASKETHLNNTSQGAEGRMVPVETLPPEAIASAERAASVLGREAFAGVDLLIGSQTGKHYILEVNQTPQIEIGAEVEQKMDALLSYMSQIAKEPTNE
ncbi:hypothetical protein CYG49_04905 [Candidatus Saccharibacteria bacterium]|nr:MAG: hypothetical protein CYG49_04905 [Candidatus Saccharibacteria bacterium]